MSCLAGLRPRITAQTAGMMSVNIILDSDSSSSDEEEPTPVKRHKGVCFVCAAVESNIVWHQELSASNSDLARTLLSIFADNISAVTW